MNNPFLSPPSAWMYTLTATRPAIKVDGPTTEEAEIVARHWAHLQGLEAQGRLIFAGRTLDLGDAGFACVIFRAASEAEARAVMESDPGVQGGVFRPHLHPYQALLPDRLAASSSPRG
jgi:uncharacterized protein YciI